MSGPLRAPASSHRARRALLIALAGLVAISAPTTATADDGTTTTTAPTTTEAPTTTDAPTTSVAPSTTTVPPTTTAPSTTAAPTTSTTPATTTVVPTTTAASTTTTTVAHATTTTAPATTTTAPPPIALAATLAAPAVPAPTCRVSMTVKLGTRGDPARCVETRLQQYGYWLAGPDDNFDSTAITALKNFQVKYGLTADGIAAKSTLVQLGIWVDPAPLPAPTCHTYVAVRLGTLNDPARCVETRLRQLGYWLQGPDSTFDATAVTALKNFQSKFGLLNDGVAATTTLKALGIWVQAPVRPPAPCTTGWAVYLGDIGLPARCLETRLSQYGYWLQGPDDRFDATAVSALRSFQNREGLAVTGVGDFATLVRLGLWKTNVFPAASCKVHISVRLNSNGVSARCVEQRLGQLGFPVTADLTFDAGSVAALRSFQYRNGLLADGVAGPRTLLRLGIYDPNPPPATAVPENSGTGRRIVYSRAQQRIWAVNASGVVENTHRVSGRLHEPYAGTYYVYSRSQYTYSASDPSVRWRYMVRFAYGPGGGRIGFHEIPNRNGVPLQSAEQLGLPLSHGCVRQSTADALWIWNWAPIGTKVVVL